MLVNAQEAAEILRVSPRHIVERLRKRRGFPKAMRPGREYLWWKEEIIFGNTYVGDLRYTVSNVGE